MSSLRDCWECWAGKSRNGVGVGRERVRWKQKKAGFFEVLGEKLTELSAAWQVAGI